MIGTIEGFEKSMEYYIGNWNSAINKIRDESLKTEASEVIKQRDFLIEQAKKLYEEIKDNFARYYDSEGNFRKDNPFSKRVIEIYQKAEQIVKVEAS